MATEKPRAMSLTSTDPQYNTPLIPASAATLVIHAETRVNAPASLVFRTLRNTETWRDWNRFVPRVTIRSQPPENDHATDAEIAELIINTSRLGSIDSDINGTNYSKPTNPPPESTRRASQSSDGLSAARRASTASASSGANPSAPPPAVAAVATEGTSRPASSASSSTAGVKLQPANNLVETSSPSTGGVLIHHGPSKGANGRGAISSAASRRHMSLTALYGEPSVRLQLNTTCTFHCRMKLPNSPNSFKDTVLSVTEVSRPDDPLAPDDNSSGLARSTTHTLSRSGVYRIVWGTDHKVEKLPRFMLSSQRVHEVRPVIRGDGKEECEIRTWECMKGLTAKTIRSTYGVYLQDRFQDWVEGLRDYCEAMGGAVERRDFIDGQTS